MTDYVVVDLEPTRLELIAAEANVSPEWLRGYLRDEIEKRRAALISKARKAVKS